MLKTKTRPATYADIEALPPHVIGEIVFGSLHVHGFPPRTGFTIGALVSELMSAFCTSRHGDYYVLSRPELHLGPHVVVPDIAGWKRERLTPFPETAFIETPPDWLAEVLSPSTQTVDRTDKLAVYAEFGVGHCCYVDPVAKTLEVLVLTGGKWLLAAAFKDADSVTAPPFEAHTFPLDVLWAPESGTASTEG